MLPPLRFLGAFQDGRRRQHQVKTSTARVLPTAGSRRHSPRKHGQLSRPHHPTLSRAHELLAVEPDLRVAAPAPLFLAARSRYMSPPLVLARALVLATCAPFS